LAAAACKKSEKSGPAVARVGDEVITADEVRQRLNETSPFLRARYSTLERKKEFVENMVRNELLAQEAVRQGYDKSPAVREQMKRAMIQELIKHQLDVKLAGTDISDDELKKFYEAHLDDFVKPERARVFHIFLPAKDAKARGDGVRTAGELHGLALAFPSQSRSPATTRSSSSAKNGLTRQASPSCCARERSSSLLARNTTGMHGADWSTATVAMRSRPERNGRFASRITRSGACSTSRRPPLIASSASSVW